MITENLIEDLKKLVREKVINCNENFLDELTQDFNKYFTDSKIRISSKKINFKRIVNIINFLKLDHRVAKIEDFYYLITDNGKVISLKSGLVLKSRLKGKIRKYDIKALHKDKEITQFTTHRLVAKYFVPNTDTENNIIVNHKDNNPLNNNYLNLEWCTYSENTQHSYDKTDRKKKTKSVYITNNRTGEVELFSSVEKASEFLNLDRSTISYNSKRGNSKKDISIEIFENKEPNSTINKKYKKLIKEIIQKGFEYEDLNRDGVKRLQINNYNFSHNFDYEGFPIITCKKSFPNFALQELKSFLLGETDLKLLKNRGINFWDKDSFSFYKKRGGEEGMEEFLKIALTKGFDLGKIYSYQMRNFNGVDQILKLIKTLKEAPFATKKTITMWNPSELDNSCLSPCHWAFEALVSPPKKGRTKNRLTIKWHQHSTDVFLGLPMNIMYYSFLCYILASICDMKPEGIIADLSNVHLYDNSIEDSKKIIEIEDKYPIVRLKHSIQETEDVNKAIESFSYELTDYTNGGVYKVEMLPYSV